VDLFVREAADGSRDPRVRHAGRTRHTLFRPFNWIGAGLDSINTAKEGSSRVITQFLGHIVRGEASSWSTAGLRNGRSRTSTMASPRCSKSSRTRTASPRQDLQHRQSGQQLVGARVAKRCLRSPNAIPVRRQRRQVTLVETTAEPTTAQAIRTSEPGAEDHQPCADLDWKPVVAMDDALTRIFDAYRGQVAEARGLVD
jgi:hypothetical protein